MVGLRAQLRESGCRAEELGVTRGKRLPGAGLLQEGTTLSRTGTRSLHSGFKKFIENPEQNKLLKILELGFLIKDSLSKKY